MSAGSRATAGCVGLLAQFPATLKACCAAATPKGARGTARPAAYYPQAAHEPGTPTP